MLYAIATIFPRLEIGMEEREIFAISKQGRTKNDGLKGRAFATGKAQEYTPVRKWKAPEE